MSSQARTNRFGVFVGLILSWRSRVFTVISEFVSESMSGDSVGVDDRSSTTSDHSPDSSFGVENGQFERSTRRSVESSDVSFFLCEISSESAWGSSEGVRGRREDDERRRPDHGRSSIGKRLSSRDGSFGRIEYGGISCDRPLGSNDRLGSLRKRKEISSEFERSRYKIGSRTYLIELGGHVEVEDLGLPVDLHSDERINLKVRKV